MLVDEQLHQAGSAVSRVICAACGKDNLIDAGEVFGSCNAVCGWVPPAPGSRKAEPAVPFGLPTATCAVQPGLPPPQLCNVSGAARTGHADEMGSEATGDGLANTLYTAVP